MWVCSAGILVLLLAAGVLLLPSKRDDREQLPCPRCNATMRYKVKLPSKIRCSCGNIMPLPPTYQHKVNRVRCPGCTETIHVSPIKKPSRVRCRCGNVADIK